MWLFAADALGDRDAAEFEKGWLDIVRREAAANGDGGFYSRRLAQIAGVSYYYFTRLESDAVLCLSYGAYWRRKFALPDDSPEFPVNPPFAWQDEYHGATFLRDGNAARSFVWHAAQGPAGVCVPADRSDMAEWQNNLRGEIRSSCTPQSTHGRSSHTLFPGGFLNSGVSEWEERNPQGEGEGVYAYASHRTACAALPDGKTMLFLEYAVMTKEATIDEIKGMSLKMPNDLFNGGKRVYRAPGNVEIELPGNPGSTDSRTVSSDRLSIDGALNVYSLYGSDTLTIRRPASREIVIHRKNGPWMYSLYADEICNTYRSGCGPGPAPEPSSSTAVTPSRRAGNSKRRFSGVSRRTACSAWLSSGTNPAAGSSRRTSGKRPPPRSSPPEQRSSPVRSSPAAWPSGNSEAAGPGAALRKRASPGLPADSLRESPALAIFCYFFYFPSCLCRRFVI